MVMQAHNYSMKFHFIADDEVPYAAFYSLTQIVDHLHKLKTHKDKHGRNSTLVSYIQYVFSIPHQTQCQSTASSNDKTNKKDGFCQ